MKNAGRKEQPEGQDGKSEKAMDISVVQQQIHVGMQVAIDDDGNEG